MEVLVGKVYRHFKGGLYVVEGIAKHTETEEKMVVYRDLCDDSKLYVRPYSMFIEKTDKNKYPLVEQEYRFKLIDIELKDKLVVGE